jgi:radical SAM protein with 4Fe4S-binding SPASM domain
MQIGAQVTNIQSAALLDFHSRVYDNFGINSVVITGGEPSLHPDFYTLLENLLNTNNIVLVTTNAIALQPSKTVELLSQHQNLRLQISMDGVTKEVYEQIRGGNTWRPFVDALGVYKNLKTSNQVGLSMTILKQNKHQIIDLIKFAEDSEFGFVHFPVLLCVGAAKKKWEEVALVAEEQFEVETALFSFISEYTGNLNISSNRLEQILTAIETGETRSCLNSPILKVTSSGEIYPCPAAVSNTKNAISSIHDIEVVESIKKSINNNLKMNIVYDNQCSNCAVNYYCLAHFCANCSMTNPECNRAFKYTCEILKKHLYEALFELAEN